MPPNSLKPQKNKKKATRRNLPPTGGFFVISNRFPGK